MTSNTEEVYEEKPYYETKEENSKNEPFVTNDEVTIPPSSKKCNCTCCRDDSGCCSSYFILVYLFRAIINVSALVLSYYFKVLMENKKRGEYEKLPLIFGLVGGIGSGIILIYGSMVVLRKCDSPGCGSYIWILMFACFWVCFYGFISLLTHGGLCFAIAIIAASDIGNMFINSVKQFRITPIIIFADFILIGTGIGVYLGLIGKFEPILNVNLVFVAVWFIGKWIVFYVLNEVLPLNKNKEFENPATYLLCYFSSWFIGAVFIIYIACIMLGECKN